MKVYIYKSGFAFFPAYASDSDATAKIKEGEIWEVEFKKSRNSKNHKRFFALLKMGFEAQDSFNSPEWWREFIIRKAGYYDSVQDPDGVWMFKAKSIAFERMDELEFRELYKAVSQVIIDTCKITEKQIEDNLNLFL